MAYTLAELQPEYERDIAAMVVTSPLAVTRQCRALLGIMDRYVVRPDIWPAWVSAIDYRESENNPRTYLGNGDPIIGTGRKTFDVPVGRGPFDTWQAGAADALRSVHLVNSLVTAAFEGERWNGFGYRHHGIPSPYLWAGTNIYQGGMYTSDGHFDPSIWDHRLGIMPILSVLGRMDENLIA